MPSRDLRYGPSIAGAAYSLADAAATPYAWRLHQLKLARMCDRRPGVAAWYDRIRQRPSFAAAVAQWMTPTSIATRISSRTRGRK
jgi:glutathione S-transferase